MIHALAGRDDEESNSLLEALVRQCADPELTMLALEAWPADGGCTPLVFALNWSGSLEVRAAAMAAIARSDPGEAEQRMLAARLVAGEEETRAAAATALEPIRDDCMDLMLIRLEADPSGAVRAALSKALAGAVDDRARRLLDKLRSSDPESALILIRSDTVPEDIKAISMADGLLTSRGGQTSHASVVAVRLEKTCVVGCKHLKVYESRQYCEIGDIVIKFGDPVSIDGRNGQLLSGVHETHEEMHILPI